MNRTTWRIGTRLLLAQALVLVGAIATAGVIAALVGPPLFHEHMLKANADHTATELQHVEEAFRVASAISLALAMAAAIILALVVSWYLTRRFQAPIIALTQAATDVSSGHYGARVPIGDAGPELDSLASAFNTMAGQLARTEDTRRRLLSDLAHELRTPVATLRAYLEGIEDGVTPWNSDTRAVLNDQVERLSRLAQDIDAVSRAEEGRISLEPAPISLADLVGAVTRAQAEAYTAKRVALEVVPRGDLTVAVDRPRILQVLTNLLDNAHRHTPEGGTVTIDWQQIDERVALSISDNGDGIPSSQLPHIFERFYRGDTARDREHRGSGIGLTISRAIAEAHGGSLDAHSDGPGTGTTFTLILPTGQVVVERR